MSKLRFRQKCKISAGNNNNKSKRRAASHKNEQLHQQLFDGPQTTQAIADQNKLIQCMRVNEMEGSRRMKLKDYEQAIMFFKRALSVHKTLDLHRADGATQSEAGIQKHVGSCYIELNLYDDALQHCRRSLKLYTKFLGPDHGKTVKALEMEQYVTLMVDPEYHEYLEKTNQTNPVSRDDFVIKQQQSHEFQDERERSSPVTTSITRTSDVRPTKMNYSDLPRLRQQNYQEIMLPETADFSEYQTNQSRKVTFREADDYDCTATSTERSLSTIIEEVDDSTVRLRIDLAIVDIKLGLLQKAHERLLKALTTAERCDKLLEIAEICEFLGDIAVQSGEYSEGRKNYNESLKAMEEYEDGKASELYDTVLAKMMGIAGLF